MSTKTDNLRLRKIAQRAVPHMAWTHRGNGALGCTGVIGRHEGETYTLGFSSWQPELTFTYSNNDEDRGIVTHTYRDFTDEGIAAFLVSSIEKMRTLSPR